MTSFGSPATELRGTIFAHRLFPAIGWRPGRMGDHHPEQLALFRALVHAASR